MSPKSVTRKASFNRQIILIVVITLCAIGFVGYQVFRSPAGRTYPRGAIFTERARLGEVTTNGVRVTLFLELDSKGQPLLRATFTPVEHGFHLYSKDLDPKTTGGLGLATRLELLSRSSVRPAGQLFADTSPQLVEIKELNVSLPIYPDGPITLRLPIQFREAGDDVSAQVALSYMACKTDGLCLLPVQQMPVEIRMPGLQRKTGALDSTAARETCAMERAQSCGSDFYARH